MAVWFRVFGSNPVEPRPEAVLEQVRQLGIAVTGNFRGDEQGWFEAELVLPAELPGLHLERYLVKEEGLRGELNAWAAWVEATPPNPYQTWLMQQLISTTQLFTLEQSWEDGQGTPLERVCLEVCRFLARETAGVYQIDRQGFFAADGKLLVEERD